MDKFWDMIEISSASHYSDQSMIKLDFSAAWVVLDFSKEVPKIFFFLEISILCDKNDFYTFHILWPELIRATVSEIWRILRFYTNDAENDIIMDDDEKFQLIWIEISRKKNILGTSLEKSKTTHAAEKINLILLWSE